MPRLFSLLFRLRLQAVLRPVFVVAVFVLTLNTSLASADTDVPNWNAASIQEYFETYPKATERLEELNRIILSLDADTPTPIRIEFDLKKLVTLTDIANKQQSADFATEVFRKYPRSQFESDVQFADTMAKIVQALAKSQDVNLAYDIVQQMREIVYQNPDAYLSYKIDASLVEIYND